MLKLKIVQNGTFVMTPEKGVIDNRPTCSLIESQGLNALDKWYVLIDLDHPAKKSSDLVTSLAAFNVSPKEINVVIFTHLHPDHMGHKDLFPNALFIFHKDEKLSFHFKHNKTLELEGDAVYDLSENGWPQYMDGMPDLRKLGNYLYIKHCPGHTKGSLVMFACIEKMIFAFVGGIFLNKSYYENWQPPGMSWNQEIIYDHMRFIQEHANVIVPGHGKPFII
ncbi:MAG: MBL fold metallo-hydrolase [Proteobacteria bacterium]|nr:MBL fold metallo-hydrolase [Pseudomonadota bacterium]